MQDKHETKIDIECTGANLDVAQPATIEEMVAFASLYAKNNKGVKHHAILQPFSALTGYNEAEAWYKGKRRMIWVDNGSHLLQDLNFEYVRLQRLKYVLADKSQIATVPDMVCQDAKKKVSFAGPSLPSDSSGAHNNYRCASAVCVPLHSSSLSILLT